ncbi:MAG: hypothetical protein AAF108_09440 [Planctomycetota bacterium]
MISKCLYCAAVVLFAHGSVGGFFHRVAGDSGERARASGDTPSFAYKSGSISTDATLRETGESDPCTFNITPRDSSWCCNSISLNKISFDYIQMFAQGTSDTVSIEFDRGADGAGTANATGVVGFTVDADVPAAELTGQFLNDPLRARYTGHIQVLDGGEALIDYTVGEENMTRPVVLKSGTLYHLDIDVQVQTDNGDDYDARMSFELRPSGSR